MGGHILKRLPKKHGKIQSHLLDCHCAEGTHTNMESLLIQLWLNGHITKKYRGNPRLHTYCAPDTTMQMREKEAQEKKVQ